MSSLCHLPWEPLCTAPRHPQPELSTQSHSIHLPAQPPLQAAQEPPRGRKDEMRPHEGAHSGQQKLSRLPLTWPCSQVGASQSGPFLPQTCRPPTSPEVVIGELLQRVGLGAHLWLCRAQLQEPDNILPLVWGHGDQGLGGHETGSSCLPWDMVKLEPSRTGQRDLVSMGGRHQAFSFSFLPMPTFLVSQASWTQNSSVSWSCGPEKKDPRPAVAPFPFRYSDNDPPTLPLGPSSTDKSLVDTHTLSLWSPKTPGPSTQKIQIIGAF